MESGCYGEEELTALYGICGKVQRREVIKKANATELGPSAISDIIA